mmetsp:Transcript_44985/g.104087  ORF Transcript_44985/g.104087 Transcript_44985/m.104087 type:complete len:941 (+) Transcript_44985:80-2902(+)
MARDNVVLVRRPPVFPALLALCVLESAAHGDVSPKLQSLGVDPHGRITTIRKQVRHSPDTHVASSLLNRDCSSDDCNEPHEVGWAYGQVASEENPLNYGVTTSASDEVDDETLRKALQVEIEKSHARTTPQEDVKNRLKGVGTTGQTGGDDGSGEQAAAGHVAISADGGKLPEQAKFEERTRDMREEIASRKWIALCIRLLWWSQVAGLALVLGFAMQRGKPPQLQVAANPAPAVPLKAPTWYFKFSGWHEDPRTAALSLCCPCILWADIMYQLQISNGWWFDVTVFAILTFSNTIIQLPLVTLGAMLILWALLRHSRAEFQKRFHIESAGVVDETLFLCWPCSLAQQSRHMKKAFHVGDAVAVELDTVRRKFDRCELLVEDERKVLEAYPVPVPESDDEEADETEKKRPKSTEEIDVPMEAEGKDVYKQILKESIYDAVVVASFGHLQTSIESLLPLKGQRMLSSGGRWHPRLVLLAGALPLFLTQNAILWAMVLDFKFTEPIPLETQSGNAKMETLLEVKMFMVVVLGVQSATELRHCINLLFFALNPATWLEIPRRPQRHDLQQASAPGEVGHEKPAGDLERPDFSNRTCALCSIFSAMMQLQVGFTVLLLSLSMILACEDVTEVVLDALSLTFITDADDLWYGFLKVALRIDEDVFAVVSKEHIIAKPLMKGDSDNSRKKKVVWYSWSKLAPARHVVTIVNGVVLTFLTQNQLVDFYVAICTKKLPMWRYFCMMYEGVRASMSTRLMRPALIPHTLVACQLYVLTWGVAHLSTNLGLKVTAERDSVYGQYLHSKAHAVDVLPCNLTWAYSEDSGGTGEKCYPDIDLHEHGLVSWNGAIKNLYRKGWNPVELDDNHIFDLKDEGVKWRCAIFSTIFILVQIVLLTGNNILSIYRATANRARKVEKKKIHEEQIVTQEPASLRAAAVASPSLDAPYPS